MKVGLIDFGIRHSAVNSLKIIEDVIDYAVHADQLGFNRFWLSEHHTFDPLVPWLNPEVLLPVIAGMTDHISVGVGGILLNHHSSYRIAYTFKLLYNLFPGRIDLGLAKGYTKNNIENNSAFQPTKENAADLFKEKTEALLKFLKEEDLCFKEEIIIPPYKGAIPPLYGLGASYNGLELIMDSGINYVRSIFHTGADLNFNKEKLDEFRESYYIRHGRFPQIILAFSGACHTSTQRAMRSYENHKFGFKPDNIVGEPAYFSDTLLKYTEDYGIDEFIFMNVALDPKDRLFGIENLSKQLNLTHGR